MLKPACLLLVALTLCTPARSTTLDELFSKGDYPAFFPQAQAAAARGDADALFLLGKAYHLGKGTTANEDKAREYYQQARSKGSARASHNLGLIELGHDRREAAIEYLQEALTRGLKMPTLYNLGRAYSPPNPTVRFFLREPIEQAGLSGDYFAQANEIEPDIKTVFMASREYLRAYQFAQQATPPDSDGLDLPAMRARALEWLQKGTARNYGPSWTNYGVLLLDGNDVAGAIAAFEKGAAQNNAVAHFHLAELAESGKWRPERSMQVNRDEAIAHYERAAQLGFEAARTPARKLLVDRLMVESDLNALEQGIERLDALRGEEDDLAEQVHSPRQRLAWGRFLDNSRRHAKPLPDSPITLRACGLDLNQPYGDAYNLGYNTKWSLEAHSSLKGPQLLKLEGRVSDKGCAVSTALPDDVRELLNQGAVLALHFPNYTLPLRWTRTPRGIELQMQPLGTPIADF